VGASACAVRRGVGPAPAGSHLVSREATYTGPSSLFLLLIVKCSNYIRFLLQRLNPTHPDTRIRPHTHIRTFSPKSSAAPSCSDTLASRRPYKPSCFCFAFWHHIENCAPLLSHYCWATGQPGTFRGLPGEESSVLRTQFLRFRTEIKDALRWMDGLGDCLHWVPFPYLVKWEQLSLL
jgi:hypothetical protein